MLYIPFPKWIHKEIFGWLNPEQLQVVSWLIKLGGLCFLGYLIIKAIIVLKELPAKDETKSKERPPFKIQIVFFAAALLIGFFLGLFFFIESIVSQASLSLPAKVIISLLIIAVFILIHGKFLSGYFKKEKLFKSDEFNTLLLFLASGVYIGVMIFFDLSSILGIFRWYGLMYLCAFGTTYLLVLYQMRKQKLDVTADMVSQYFAYGIIGLLIGARLFAVLFFDESHRVFQEPWIIFWPFDKDMNFVGLQGMNYYGGVVGGVAGLWFYCYRHKRSLMEWGDMTTAAIPLGYTFGRLGNFINAELFGRVTTAPWGMTFPDAKKFPTIEAWVRETAETVGMDIKGIDMLNLPRHPSMVYEGITEGILLWLIIWFIFRKRNPFPGFIIGIYIIGYGLIRFIVDYFRISLTGDFAITLGDGAQYPERLLSLWNFIPSQIWSLLMVLGGVLFLLLRYHLNKNKQQELTPENKTDGKWKKRRIRKQISKK